MHWQGELLHIHVAPKASAPMDALSEARLVAGIGIEGDRYATRLGTYSKKHHIDRQATLIEVEALEALARDHNIELAPHVDGIPDIVQAFVASMGADVTGTAGDPWRPTVAQQIRILGAFLNGALDIDSEFAARELTAIAALPGVTLTEGISRVS